MAVDENKQDKKLNQVNRFIYIYINILVIRFIYFNLSLSQFTKPVTPNEVLTLLTYNVLIFL